jgi:hypothetical protein
MANNSVLLFAMQSYGKFIKIPPFTLNDIGFIALSAI